MIAVEAFKCLTLIRYSISKRRKNRNKLNDIIKRNLSNRIEPQTLNLI